MNKWVECLCNVCGFKPDPKEQALQSGNSSSLEEWPVQPAPVQPVQSSPARSVSSLADQQSLQQSESSSSTTPVRRPSTQESYIPLGECYSDSKTPDRSTPNRKTNTSPLDQVPPAPGRRRRGSTDSIPEMMAPVPPNKTGERIELQGDPLQTYDQPSKSYVNIDVFDQDDGVYKVPPRRSMQADPNQGFYKVPPSKHMEFKDSTDGWQQIPENGGSYHPEMEYDVPPSHRPTPARRGSNQRDSGSSSSSRGSHRPEPTMDSFYDCPRSQGYDTSSMQKGVLYTNQEAYDVPPARRTASLENVPPPPRPAKSAILPGPQTQYQNIPTNSKSAIFPSRSLDQTYDTPRKPSDVEILNMSPPPPQPHTTPRLHGYVNSVAGYPPSNQHESLYLPMQGGGPVDPQQLYLPMSEQGFYTDMSGVQSIYTAPPSNKPLPGRATSTTPPRLQRLQVAPNDVEGGDSYAIVSTSRTKSFKRATNQLPMPTRKPAVDGHDDTSDDESDSDERRAQLENMPLKSVQAADPTGGNKTSLNSTPPPPQRSGEIQYLDLYHDDNADAEKPPGSAFATVPPPGNITPTDYKEIDFIKTKALSDTRKDLESKRKSSERSVDE